MAERTETWKECDRKLCRLKKDVAKYRVVVSKVAPGDIIDEVLMDITGEQCPGHIEQLIERNQYAFHNTKTYPSSKPVEDTPDPLRAERLG